VGGALAGCSTAPVPYNANVIGGIPHDEEMPTPSLGPGGQTIGIAIASTSEIPVGGGTIFAKDNIVVTQPAAGVFKAFGIVCTHVGCLCDKVANGTIDCPCHGSTFSIADGAVVTGPATQPLTPAPITIVDGSITLM
jgi:nitrite reductase/ring-hydroxylating ferredoxin subunit